MFCSSGWNSFCQFAVCAHRVSFCLFFLYKHSKSESTQCLLNFGYSRCWIHFCSILATHSITWSGPTSNDRNCLAKSRGLCFPCSKSCKWDFIILSFLPLSPWRHEQCESEFKNAESMQFVFRTEKGWKKLPFPVHKSVKAQGSRVFADFSFAFNSSNRAC